MEIGLRQIEQRDPLYIIFFKVFLSDGTRTFEQMVHISTG